MRRTIFLLLLGALTVFGIWRYQHLTRGSHSRGKGFTPADGSGINAKNLPVLTSLDAEYTRLLEAVVPSVVSITSRTERQTPRIVDPFEFFFGSRQQAPQFALGSGVIVSKEGHILTNNHVVSGNTGIAVRLTDGRQVAARLIGSDQRTDIAVLQIQAGKVTPLPLGDSDQVHVGQVVFAIGNPYGLQETVTHGIVSARRRRALSDSSVDFVQTDAPVNEGNSGGPLLNLRGEIIGINTEIISKTGGSVGISLAVASNTARETLEAVLKAGRAERGYIGVTVGALSPELAAQLGVHDLRGAVIYSVMPGSPAEAVGLQSGDIIRQVNGKPVTAFSDVLTRVAELPVGSKFGIVFEREGKILTVSTTIAEAPPTPLNIPGPARPR
jgi:Do/DeqQ family serine protease